MPGHFGICMPHGGNTMYLANMPDFRKNLTRFSRLNSAYEREVKVYDLHLRNSKDRRSENGQRKKRI